jgi:L-ascorbate metabolism protein UlaG (beta-lactamase superfamily)
MPPPLRTLSFVWLGHSTFLFRSPGGKSLVIDPWLTTNPACPEDKKKIRDLDLLLLTHGHDDHTADAIAVARSTDARVVAPYELAAWIEEKGIRHVTAMNVGGTLSMLGVSITMVHAFHSSSIVEDGRRRDVGPAVGYVITFEDGVTIYFAGDTGIFGDMRLIGELYRPAIAFLPIGGLYTMGPEQAAKACELLGVTRVVPMHYRTWPSLTGTPEQLRALVEPRGVRVSELQPGETAG